MNCSRYCGVIVFYICLCCFDCCSSIAQLSVGQIDGTISDAQQAVLPQTSVKLRDSRGRVLQETVTNSIGYFVFHAVPAGTYTLRIGHSGFSSVEKSTIVVAGQSSIPVDVDLVTENVSQTVTVNGGQDPLTTISSTGTRLGLDPLKTPAAISILSREVLEARGYDQIQDAVRSMPGASSGGSPADPSQFVVRGFVGNQVTLVRDGIYVGPADMVNREENSFNLQSVELLSGPGSILYGQGAVGGTINVVTRKPAFTPLSFNTYESYGSFNTYEAAAGAGGQINRALAFRADFSYYSSDGYVKRSNPDNLNGTGSLLWKIRDNLSVRLALDVLKDDLSSYYGTPFVSGTFGADSLRGVLLNSKGLVLDARMRFNNYNVSDNVLHSASYQPSVTLDWQPTANLNVTDQAYYYHAERHWENAETYTFLGPNNGQVDANGNPIPDNVIARDRFHVFHNQNLPGNSLNAAWFHKLFGLDNKITGGYEFYNVGFVRTSGFPHATYVDWVDPLNPIQGSYGPYPGDFPSKVSPTKITDNAGYFEDALSVTHKLILVTGIRLENLYLRRLNYDQSGSPEPSLDFGGNYHPFNYRAGLVYSPTPTLSLYGQFTTAQDPPNGDIFSVNATNPPFRLAKSMEGEVGVKDILPKGFGEAKLAFYDISRNHILTVTQAEVSSDNGQQTSKGFELSAILHPVRSVDVNFNTSYVAAKYGTFFDPNTGLNDTGKIPADVPATTTNLWADIHQLGKIPLELGAGWHFVGGRWGDNANQTQLFNYSNFDLYGSYRIAERLSFTARSKNLFNKTYAQWADIFYPPEIVLGAPRSYSISFTAFF